MSIISESAFSGNPFRPSLSTSKAGAYPWQITFQVLHSMVGGQGPNYKTIDYDGKVSMDEHSSLLQTLVNYG
jgi:hypothetical protein